MTTKYVEAVKQISQCLYKSIRTERLRVRRYTYQFVSETQWQDIWKEFRLAIIVDGAFDDTIHKILHDQLDPDKSGCYLAGLQTKLQGVYIGIVPEPVVGKRAYVGCSYGQKGLQNRVINQHMNEKYRGTQEDKVFYQSIVTLENPWDTYWVRLIAFRDKLSQEMVEWFEACMMILLHTINDPGYMSCRPTWLPVQSSSYGLNQTLPFRVPIEFYDVNKRIHFKRCETLEKIRTIGAKWNVIRWQEDPEDSSQAQFWFNLYGMHINIPVGFGRAWYPDNEGVGYLRFDISPSGPHPEQWSEADDNSTGSRLGIQLYKSRDLDESTSCWLRRKYEAGALAANTIADMLEGRILDVGFDFEAPENRDRKWIFTEHVNKACISWPKNRKRRKAQGGIDRKKYKQWRKESHKMVKDIGSVAAQKKIEKQKLSQLRKEEADHKKLKTPETIVAQI